MSIDMFAPRTMRAALKEMKPARQFLRSLFFPTVETSFTENVDIDVMVGARRLAPFVSVNGPGKTMDRIGFSTSSVTPPMVAPKRAMTVQDLQQRTPGEHAYSGRTPEDRARELLGMDLAELDEAITRREEWMCARALFDSAIVISGEDVSRTITFTRDASLVKGTLAASGAAGRWSHADAEIAEQFRSYRRAIVKLCGVAPDYAIMGSDAADALLKNAKVTGTDGALNTRKAEMGLIAPELRDSGATYIGEFAATGISLWSYDEWYIDPDDGVEKPIVPAKSLLVGSSRARTAMRYGAVGVKSGDSIGLVADSRVPQSWVTEEPAVRHLKISSRPLPVPIQNNAFLTATVLV